MTDGRSGSGPVLARDPARPAPPVRLVHLGLGNFFRAHQAWYTDQAPDASEWGYAAFSGTGRGNLAARLAGQQGLYTLITRSADTDLFAVVRSLAATHSIEDHQAWLGYFSSAELSAVTVTVTEAGYLRGADGALDLDRDGVQADLATLRRDPRAVVRTAPGRLVAGLLARRRADAGPLALIPCDNLPGNGTVLGRVVRDFAGRVDPTLPVWLDASVSVVTTAVDRITPSTTAADVEAVRLSTGVRDACPVVTEPFQEWVLSGSFPNGRPAWDAAGATFTDDVTPFEHRKLWLLNGGHSLLAYAGLLRGHETVAQAVSDELCQAWLQQWWDLAATRLPQPAAELGRYRAALLERFANPRIQHRLAQIAADGSQKLPIRVLPVLRLERAEGGLPQPALRILAAWIGALRSHQLTDVRAAEVRARAAGGLPDAVPRLLEVLAPELAADAELVAAVVTAAGELGR
ncbi:MAG TPA: mannitol dehydrogenase family protein [Jatrophihabitans sp.]|nr:mannitol dehydrogenase family protein [Jatrophihabitans sp.]